MSIDSRTTKLPPRSGRRFTVMLLLALSFTSLQATQALAMDGDHGDGHGIHFPITTDQAPAQSAFNRGLELAWGFNHLEGAAAFREAAAADPACGMCWWGVALVLGPNINDRFDLTYHDEILEALAKAESLSAKASESERALIAALGERYANAPQQDRSALDHAYARAMRRVARRFPDDLHIQTLFAEALMDTTAWNYWKEDGQPRDVTKEFLGTLESVLKRDPTHAGANHLLIHAVEQERPEAGVAAADRLAASSQATGHLVHMASHIYIRVGRYDDAIRINERAIADDDEYAASHEVPSEYNGYMLHNHHMLAINAMLDGQSKKVEKALEHIHTAVDRDAMREPVYGAGQLYFASHLFSKVRFEQWDKILAQDQPLSDLALPRAVWHFATGMAKLGRGESAATNLDALRALAADESIEETSIWGLNSVRRLVEIASHTLAGESARASGAEEQAIAELERALMIEDALVYDEPPPWPLSTRWYLGRALLEAGQPAQAARRFEEDLSTYPRNGWSLAGLVVANEAGGTRDNETRQKLQQAWQRADIAPPLGLRLGTGSDSGP